MSISAKNNVHPLSAPVPIGLPHPIFEATFLDGELVAEGTPEQICADPQSCTGQYLQKYVQEHDHKNCLG
ncbi:MAG: hypothetical protein AB2L21_01545 [Anaerolineaceae bacterium]